MNEIGAQLYLVLKVAAVVFGLLGGAFVGRLLAPLATADKRLKKGVVLGSALFGAFAMWLAVTRSGGGGFGLGSGDGWGLPGRGTGTAGQAEKGEKKDTGIEPAPTPPRPAPRVEPLRVKVLGGARVADQRFYVIGNDPPRNWDELLQAVAEAHKREPSLKEIEIVLYKDSVDPANPAVAGLVKWAKENGYTPKVSFPDQTLP